MNKYMYMTACLFFFLTLSAQEDEGQAYSVLSGDSLSADIGLIPESLDANVDSLMKTWHVQYFSKVEDYCHDDSDNVYFPDEVIRDRLSRLPSVIPMTYNNIVRNSINLYAERRRGLVRYMLGMADFYFPIIEQILDENGLPIELKYLAVVESALNPVAISRVGACGLWQFMLPTAKAYGLEINSLVDDRRDPVKSTYAACRYFKDMYAIYGDWQLVLAAYNCGPGNVNRAIRRAGGKTDFWQIFQYLPRETRSYVPLFIAANYIMNYFCDHNICPIQTTLPMATDTIMVSQMLHMEQVSDLLKIDMEQLRVLNPQYRRDIVPGNVKPSALKLPLTDSFAFVDKEDSIYRHRLGDLLANNLYDANNQLTAPTREQVIHVAKSGENLYTIADKYGVNARDIRKWNGLGSNRVAVGRKIKVYVDNGGVSFASNTQKENTATKTQAQAAPSAQTRTATARTTAATPVKAASDNKEYVTYKVQSGDSLYSISQKYPGISAATLQKVNNLPNTKIRPGQILKIPVG